VFHEQLDFRQLPAAYFFGIKPFFFLVQDFLGFNFDSAKFPGLFFALEDVFGGIKCQMFGEKKIFAGKTQVFSIIINVI
jgi:hypothetical protein